MKGLYVGILISVLGSGSAPAQKQIIKIGLASNFSDLAENSFNPFGSAVRNGAQLALEEINRELSKKNLQIALDEFDYGANKLNVRKTAKKAIDAGSIAIIGYEYSDDALLAAPVHVASKVPMLTPSASADRLNEFPKYVHQGTFSNFYQAKILAEVAATNLQAKQAVTIVAKDCAYCTDLAQSFAEAFEKRGGKITKTIGVLNDAKNMAPVVAAVKAASSDFIFLPNQEIIAGRVIAALLSNGYRKPFLGGDGWRTLGGQVFDFPVGPFFQGWMTSHWKDDRGTPEANAFVQKYNRKYGANPTDSAALTYDCLHMVGNALANMKKFTPAALEAELAKHFSFKGVTGNSVYRGQAAPEKTVLLLKSKQGQFVIDQAIEPGRNK